MTKVEVWHYLNSLKEETVKHLPQEQWLDVKLACDELFSISTNRQYSICPAWWIIL